MFNGKRIIGKIVGTGCEGGCAIVEIPHPVLGRTHLLLGEKAPSQKVEAIRDMFPDRKFAKHDLLVISLLDAVKIGPDVWITQLEFELVGGEPEELISRRVEVPKDV